MGLKQRSGDADVGVIHSQVTGNHRKGGDS